MPSLAGLYPECRQGRSLTAHWLQDSETEMAGASIWVFSPHLYSHLLFCRVSFVQPSVRCPSSHFTSLLRAWLSFILWGWQNSRRLLRHQLWHSARTEVTRSTVATFTLTKLGNAFADTLDSVCPHAGHRMSRKGDISNRVTRERFYTSSLLAKDKRLR